MAELKCSRCGGETRNAVLNIVPKNHVWVLPAENDGNQFAPSSKLEAHVCLTCGNVDFNVADLGVFLKSGK